MSGQPTGSSTQLEEIDIDFSVSGLPHAVVKQAQNSAMLRMPCLLDSRHRLLHLWASLERESIQPRYPLMDIGSSLNTELCH